MAAGRAARGAHVARRHDAVVLRVCVVGNSGSGKTHLARRLAARLGVPHVELDALHHRAGWQPAPLDDVRSDVVARLREHEERHGGWVVDGNYRRLVADLLHPDAYVWLDYPRGLVLRRVVLRTLGRLVLRRELWNGNRERWRNLADRDPRENIVLWSWTHHDGYRQLYAAASAADQQARWVRLSHPRETERWLSSVPPQAHPGAGRE